jgi:hypothetical protein
MFRPQSGASEQPSRNRQNSDGKQPGITSNSIHFRRLQEFLLEIAARFA